MHALNLKSPLRSTHFRTKRKFRVLREIIGNLEPQGFARRVEVAFGMYTWVIIETAKSNSKFEGAFGAFYNR
jgi:hypothetical protein